MSDVATAPAPAPVAAEPAPPAPAPAPAATPPAPAPAPAPADDASLLKQPDPYAWLDQKFRVNGADGKLDLDASSKKLNESYVHLSKRMGTGDVPPATVNDYVFQPPEQFKDVQLDDAMSQTFRERAHKLGLTTQQYQGVMESYLELVPNVLDSVLKVSAEQARTELQKVWQSQAEFDAGIAAAQRMVDSLPAALGEEVWARFGRDPLFFQVAAIFGKEMAEDKSPSTPTGGGQNQDAMQLMASEAYRNPRHPEHVQVSAKVRQLFEQQHGTARPFQ